MERVHPRVGGFGSVDGVPRLPQGFRETFQSYLVKTKDVTLHAVVGGEGPPLLLLGGWPQTWFSWRYLMQSLASQYRVIAVDGRGVGLSEKPADGYDAQSLAGDMFALMDALGHTQFRMVGYDVGMWVGFIMAADQPSRIARIALGEAIIPGLSPSPPLLSDDRLTSDIMWHFNFNRALGVNERLVEGREDIYFNYQFATKAGSVDGVPTYARDFYIETLRRVPGALRASFEVYRAIDASIPQYRQRAQARIQVPVLTFAGALACGGLVEQEIRSVADDVQSIVIEGSGHYPAEERPEILLEALHAFLRG